MPPQEKIPPQDKDCEDKRTSYRPDVVQSHPVSTHGYSKTDEDTMLRVPGEPEEDHEMTSIDRIPEVTDANPNTTQTEDNNGQVSSWNAVKLRMIRQSSVSDNGPEGKNVEVNEKPGSPAAISSPVREEKSLMDFDDMLPHIGEFGLYQKILFALLAPFAFFVAFVYFTQIFITVTPEGYWCRIPELMNLTVEQRLVSAQTQCRDGGRAGPGIIMVLRVLDCRKKY